MQNTQISSIASADSTLLEPTRPLIVRAADSPILPGAPGESGAFMLTGAHTDGRVTLASTYVDVNGGPPPHVHQNEEEIFVVQSGAFELLVNGELVEARAGDVAYMARGEAHRFRGLDSGEPNHFHIIVAPSGFEDFMARWIPLFDNGAPDMQLAVQTCADYGITLYPSDAVAPVASSPQTKVIPGSTPPMQVLGTNVTILLNSNDTQGRYSLIRVEAPRDSGPPLHIHVNEDEMFIIEEGTIEITLGEEKFMAEVGDVVWAPRGYPHTFRIASDTARLVAFITPGGFEDYFTECAEIQRTSGMDFPAIVALGEKLGMSLLLPSA